MMNMSYIVLYALNSHWNCRALNTLEKAFRHPSILSDVLKVLHVWRSLFSITLKPYYINWAGSQGTQSEPYNTNPVSLPQDHSFPLKQATKIPGFSAKMDVRIMESVHFPGTNDSLSIRANG